MSSPYCVVYVTTPPGVKGKRIAKEIVNKRLAACVNIVPKVESVYWWKGKAVSDTESLLVIKTKKTQMNKLITFVKKIHPYDVPEIISLPIQKGHKPYLNWIKKEARG